MVYMKLRENLHYEIANIHKARKLKVTLIPLYSSPFPRWCIRKMLKICSCTLNFKPDSYRVLCFYQCLSLRLIFGLQNCFTNLHFPSALFQKVSWSLIDTFCEYIHLSRKEQNFESLAKNGFSPRSDDGTCVN